MSDKRKDILKINQYLQGKLDNKAMHQLERDAQDDPFFMDALDGYEAASKDQQKNLADLDNRLAQRITDKKERSILLWRVLPIAASVLLMIGVVYWFLNKPIKEEYANSIPHAKQQPTIVSNAPRIKGEALSAPAPLRKPHGKHIIKPAIDANHLNDSITMAANALRDKPIIPDNSYSTIGKEVQDNPVGNAEHLLQGKIADASTPVRKVVITGKVIDATTHEVMTGATIGTQGKGLTQADANGNYSVLVDDGATLVVTNMGYINQAIKLKPGQQNLNINLVPANRSLSEVVIRGYVKRDKDQTTGSSYIVTGKEVKDNPVGNVEQLLQGKVAGLNVQNNTGAPGMRGSVNIRGLSTIDSAKWNTLAKEASKKYQTITGRITDSTGAPLEAATIGAFGRGVTRTDKDGKFTAKVPADVNSLFVSSIGYISQQVRVNKQSSLAITMLPRVTQLHETLIRGYVKRNRDETTGSSYIVTGKEIVEKPSANQPPPFPGGKIPGKFLPANPNTQGKQIAKGAGCNENLKFKKEFFNNIALIDKHTQEVLHGTKSTVSTQQFLKALNFIAGYHTVTINIDKGSTAEYPDMQSYQSEKTEWLDWYEANKCSGLK